uniref:Uncharacterized protein n=1 Tax=Anguilla anguilla TaxID=7936 RepID=A0A0E9XJS9_ANGAN
MCVCALSMLSHMANHLMSSKLLFVDVNAGSISHCNAELITEKHCIHALDVALSAIRFQVSMSSLPGFNLNINVNL